MPARDLTSPLSRPPFPGSASRGVPNRLSNRPGARLSTADTFFIVGFSTDQERRLLLNRARNFLRSRLSLLGALLAILAVTLVALPQPAAMAACPDAARVNYYSDATLTVMVGQCWHDCCKLWSCSGQLTDYYTVRMRSCSVQ